MCLIFTDNPASPPIHESWLRNFYSYNPHGYGFMYAADGKVHVEKEVGSVDGFVAVYKKHRALGVLFVCHLRMRTHGAVSTDNVHPYKVTDDMYLMHNGILSQGYGDAKPHHPEILAEKARLKAAEERYIGSLAKHTPANTDEVGGAVSLLEGGERQSGWSLSGYGFDGFEEEDDYDFSYGVGGILPGAVPTTHPQKQTTAEERAAAVDARQQKEAERHFSDTWHYIEDFVRPMMQTFGEDSIAKPAYQRYLVDHIGSRNKFIVQRSNGEVWVFNKKAGVTVGDRWLSNTYAWSSRAGADLTAQMPPPQNVLRHISPNERTQTVNTPGRRGASSSIEGTSVKQKGSFVYRKGADGLFTKTARVVDDKPPVVAQAPKARAKARANTKANTRAKK